MITQRTSILYAIFFFNDTATTEIYTLSLHDALPISSEPLLLEPEAELVEKPHRRDRRLPPALGQVVDERAQHTGLQLVRSEEHTSDSSHGYISYAVFCLKKKKP